MKKWIRKAQMVLSYAEFPEVLLGFLLHAEGLLKRVIWKEAGKVF
jgi:hypothetical protein